MPWAEYAEIGIHASDVSRVPWLQRGGADADGFVWERATKGHYYRVAYSATNRVYVLVLPFTARNGTMWPADWVLAHQKEFSERHLHPLAQVTYPLDLPSYSVPRIVEDSLVSYIDQTEVFALDCITENIFNIVYILKLILDTVLNCFLLVDCTINSHIIMVTS